MRDFQFEACIALKKIFSSVSRSWRVVEMFSNCDNVLWWLTKSFSDVKCLVRWTESERRGVVPANS